LGIYRYVAVICFVLALPIGALSGETDADIAGSISFMIGDVYVSGDGTNWREADFDMKIRDGEYVKTGGESRCEIILNDDIIVRMEEDSVQRIGKADPQAGAEKESVFLSAGKVWVNARKMLSKGDSFTVRTNKAVCAIRGTTFSVDEKQEDTRIRVHKGKVATWHSLFETKKEQPGSPPVLAEPVPVKGPHPVPMTEWVEIVSALQQITIDRKGAYEKRVFSLETVSDDPWVAWNLSRDGRAPAE